MDDDQRYAAAASKDARFDGVFFCAVRTTGIYCRPSCPAIMPKRVNVAFYPTAAAAQQAGFRACKRCRPDASPGSPEWNARSDAAGRAMRLIADGVVDRSGVTGLADSLGYSPRQVGRLLTSEVGAGPLALARAQRARTARILVETSALPLGDVAFAAGFSSIRQVNATMLEVYDTPPSVLRERARRRDESAAARPRGRRRPGLVETTEGEDGGATGVLRLRLPFRPPIDTGRMFGFLAARAIPGVEVASAGSYERTISLPNGFGILSLHAVPDGNWVDCSLVLSDLRDVTAAVQRCRRLLDLDADPSAISGFFRDDPLIGPLAAGCPGRRAVGAVDGNEIAIRAVLGQQVTVAAARRLGARLVELCGTPLPAATASGLTHVFPDAATIAGFDPAVLCARWQKTPSDRAHDTARPPGGRPPVPPAGLPMPLARGRAVVTVAAALAAGEISLGPGADWEEAGARLVALPGIGPWTAGYIRMRALSDPDVCLPGDAGLLRALRNLTGGAGAVGSRPGGKARPAAELLSTAERWRPWRSYATHYLWATLESAPAEVADIEHDEVAV